MQNQLDLEALKAELADKKALLADIESGKITLGSLFENREVGIRRRISAIELQIRRLDASRT